MDQKQRKELQESLSKFCLFAGEHDDIFITEWTNGEGFDVTIEARKSHKSISLTDGEFRALVALGMYITNLED